MTQYIESLIEKYHLQHLQHEIMSAVFSCLKVIPARANIVPAGSSKMGGVPDFPPNLQYPTYKGIPLQFLAQFNLAELQKSGLRNDLPKQGMLYFFYLEDSFEHAYGNFNEREGWRVLFYDGPLNELEAPAQVKSSYPQCSISFQAVHKVVQLFIEDEQDDDRFLQMLEELMPDNYDNHQIFGFPFSIQGEIFEELEDYTNVDEQNMTLLFQIDSDQETLNMMWGDSGMLYFCISNEALRELRFEEAWCMLQSL